MRRQTTTTIPGSGSARSHRKCGKLARPQCSRNDTFRRSSIAGLVRDALVHPAGSEIAGQNYSFLRARDFRPETPAIVNVSRISEYDHV